MVEIVPILFDNYAYLIHDPASGRTAAVDPAEPQPVLDRLKNKGWQLDWILNTHHHADHSGGNLALKAKTGAQVVGSAADAGRIPGIDQTVDEGDRFCVGGIELEVWLIPGHTSGHLAFWWREGEAVFTGDTLFTGGCGRVFEGTAEQMWTSLCRLRALPESTKIYCGHEYTKKNLEFALSLSPNHLGIRRRYETVCDQIQNEQPTVPEMMALEKQTNPFLLSDDASWQKETGAGTHDPVAVFQFLRDAKDRF